MWGVGAQVRLPEPRDFNTAPPPSLLAWALYEYSHRDSSLSWDMLCGYMRTDSGNFVEKVSRRKLSWSMTAPQMCRGPMSPHQGHFLPAPPPPSPPMHSLESSPHIPAHHVALNTPSTL